MTLPYGLMGHIAHELPEVVIGQLQLRHVSRAVLDDEAFDPAALIFVVLLQNVIVPVEEFLPVRQRTGLLLYLQPKSGGHMAHLLVFIFRELHLVADNVQQI